MRSCQLHEKQHCVTQVQTSSLNLLSFAKFHHSSINTCLNYARYQPSCLDRKFTH